MADFPRISIVTPNYNYSQFIESTLCSVLDQRYPNLEYIVLDDGSTDRSVEIIRKYGDRLSHWETGPNRGQYKTITAGFEQATGEIFGWLNSDDMLLPHALRAVADIFATFPHVEWISSLHLGHWDWNGYLLGFSRNQGYSRNAFLDGRNLPSESNDPEGVPPRNREYIQQESTFWRRSLWERAGGYVSHEFGAAGDYELWARFYRHAELIGVDIPLSGFRHQQTQQTSQLAKYADLCMPVQRTYREEVRWSRSPARAIVNAIKALPVPQLPTAPGLREFGYSGQRIVRRDERTQSAHWAMEKYAFL